MGQSSIPTLNKTGNSMYWNSMWDDKHNFNKSLHESMFLKEFIPSMFANIAAENFIKYLDNYNFLKKPGLHKYNIRVKHKFRLGELIKEKKKNRRYFFSNIWIMKFQNFIIIYFFLYNPVFKDSFFFLKKKKKFKKSFLSSIMLNYVNSVINIKVKKKNDINIQHKKYVF